MAEIKFSEMSRKMKKKEMRGENMCNAGGEPAEQFNESREARDE